MPDLLTRHLVREEGIRLHPYKDHLGFWTIGVGHLIDRRKGGRLPDNIRSFPISRGQAIRMLEDDIGDVYDPLAERRPWTMELDEVRLVILLAMAFQMGVNGLLGFRRTLLMIKAGDYDLAARAMLHSKWARQTPERASRLSVAMRTGRLEV